PDARLGQAIQSPAAGSMARRREGRRRWSSARLLVETTIASSGPRTRDLTVTVSGRSPINSSNPPGAETNATRCPSLIPSFLASGVSEYPGTSIFHLVGQDDGYPIHYAAVKRGTPVYASDGFRVGKVDE